VTWAATPRLRGSLLAVAAGTVGALATGRPEAVALAAPFAVLLLAGLGQRHPDPPHVTVHVERERIVEGEDVDVELGVTADAPVELELLPPRALHIATGANPIGLACRASAPRIARVSLHPERWGAYRIGEVVVRCNAGLGLFAGYRHFEGRAELRVYPRPEPLRATLAPRRTHASAGSRVSHERGDGMEFAEVRPFLPGDRVRRINARVSARRGALHVTERHPERNSDVVILLDTFAEARSADAGSLDLAVRAAAALAERHLHERDRVGVIGFGGALRWLEPGLGMGQRYRIADALITSAITFSYVWMTVATLPARILPPGALVIGLTPLIDERMIVALADLAGRGHDVAVVEVSPRAFLPPARSERESLARRIWALQRDAIRARYARLGMPVTTWEPGDPLEPTLREVSAWRRRRVVRA
jgi:uncharacterized protein (DUF58 family)